MVILTVGLNHTTAPVEIRERLHLSGTALPPFFERLVQEGGVNERLVASPLHRGGGSPFPGQRHPRSSNALYRRGESTSGSCSRPVTGWRSMRSQRTRSTPR